jgi:hypothetical protein
MGCKQVKCSAAQQLYLQTRRQLLKGRVRDCCSTHKSSVLYTPAVVTNGPMSHHVRLAWQLVITVPDGKLASGQGARELHSHKAVPTLDLGVWRL